MSSNSHHIDELIEWYALGTLLPSERAEVTAHIAVCERCHALAAEAVSTVNMLPYTVEPRTPSPHLKSRLMARVDADLRGARAAAVPVEPSRNLLDQLAQLLRSWSPGLAMAGAALVVLLALWNWNLQNELARTQAELNNIVTTATHVALLPPAASAPKDAQAKLFVAANRQAAVLAVSGLKRLGADQVYEFWLIRGGKPVPAGTFNVNPDGSALFKVESAEPLGSFDQAGITIEKAGGADVPNMTALVFAGSIKP